MLVRRFLGVTDRLFGAVSLDDGPARAWTWLYLGVSALVVMIIALRQPDSLLHQQFFAGDALVYYPQNTAPGFGRALARL